MKLKIAKRVSGVEEYYFSSKLREIAEMRAQGIDVINLGIGSPDLMPSEPVVKALQHMSGQSDVHGYQSYNGIPEVRKAFAAWSSKYLACDLDSAREILPLIGSKEGIVHLSMTYLEEGDQVLVPNPGYPAYRAAALLAGAEPISYDLSAEGGWLPDFEALSQIDLTGVKLMWVNYPHMPSGASATLSDFEQIVSFGRQHDILICHDNPYAFILNDRPLSIMQAEGAIDHAVELHSMSKTFNMAGWRVGFLVGRHDRISDVLRFKSNMDSGMFRPLQLAAAVALEQPSVWYDQLNEVYRERRQVAEQIMHGLDCAYDTDQVGMFLWGKIPDHTPDGYAYSDIVLRQANVFMTPGNIFGSNGARYVRLSLCSPVDLLSKALSRIISLQTLVP